MSFVCPSPVMPNCLFCDCQNSNLMSWQQQSIQLIAVNHQSEFYLTPEAARFLASIKKPVAVVAIAGAYRSGKSYLANRLLRNSGGFATGATVGAVTKGLRVWGRPISAEDEEGREFVYLAVDSEGVGSCEQEVRYDVKILMLVLLVSSTVIYNSVGAIDQLALDHLRTVLNLAQALPHAPHRAKLVWVLRDFALQLVGRNGRQMTADQYLEQCLEEVPSSNIEIRKKNEIRKAIKENFPQRRCFPLVRPTIKEEDLRDLDRSTLRPEFIEGIDAIREEVFSGSGQDMRRAAGAALTGKLLASLLEECCIAINQNKVPEIMTMWESIRSCAAEEGFQRLAGQMKEEMSKITLPLTKEDLKSRLNQLQNRMYLRLEKEFPQSDHFRKYHREFLLVAQKLTKEVKRNNAALLKEKTLRELRDFVRSNISLSSVEPTSLTLLKAPIQRMELRTRGEPEAYEYVLSVLFDVMHISEQKALQMQREAAERQQLFEAGCMERRNADLSMATLRHDYHQALKTITNLKLTQEAAQRENALCRQQLDMLQANSKAFQQDGDIKVEALLRQLEEANQRARQRAEEHSALTRRLREEKAEAERELEALKEERLRQGLNQRKQIIFEEKMKETWDRFEEQRLFFRKEIDKLRKQAETHLQKYEEEKKYREREAQQFAREKESFLSKERESLQQLQELKSLHAETKKTYTATFDALRDNDRILHNIENVSLSRPSTVKKPQQDAVRRHLEGELDRTRTEFEEELRRVREELRVAKAELAKANLLVQQQRTKNSQQEARYKTCLSERERLQRELQSANLRFSDTVGEIEQAKQRQRSLYEESIVRLLNNLEKRESSFSQSFYRR